MSYDFFAFMNRMKNIKRWSLMRSVQEENIMEHSQQVAMIAHALALIANSKFNYNLDLYKVLCLAQYHEAGEVITGDLPTPIKYFNKDIQYAYKDLEKKSCEKLLEMLPVELKPIYSQWVVPETQTLEYAVMKYADKISAYIKCIEELKAGNSEFVKAKQTIETELLSIDFPAVKYFLDNIIPGYQKTLDELQLID